MEPRTRRLAQIGAGLTGTDAAIAGGFGLRTAKGVVLLAFALGAAFLVGQSKAPPLIFVIALVAMLALYWFGSPARAKIAGGRGKQIEADKGQLDLLADTVADAIFRYDLEGYCTYASSSTRDVLGADPSTFIGKRASDRMRIDARERIERAEQRLLSSTSESERFTCRRSLDADNGSPVYLEAACALARNPQTGEAEGVVACVRDVTERVELELLLIQERNQAERAARAKSVFLGRMSQRLRTPMSDVLGIAEQMLDSDLDPEQRRNIRMIVESGRSMMLLLGDIVDLSAVEAGEIAIDPAPVDLKATIEHCVSLNRSVAEAKGLHLKWDFAAQDGLPHWVETDDARVKQIVLNLIRNAVRFTEAGQIHVRCLVEEDAFSVAVSDTGIGIAQSRLDAIFEPFGHARSDDAARGVGGSGLGLSISRQLAELMGGFINVESDPGEGSCFTLSLPHTPVEPDELRVPERGIDTAFEPSEIEPEEEQKSARILLAEDNDSDQAAITGMLERCGQSVAIAHDGNEAIAMVFDGLVRGRPFDLVLMDLQMPGCSGYAAARAIREEGIGPQELPIIALSNTALPEDIVASRKVGMQAHLAKPVALASLARVLQRWMPTHIIETSDPVGDDAISARRAAR